MGFMLTPEGLSEACLFSANELHTIWHEMIMTLKSISCYDRGRRVVDNRMTAKD
jgi:hypothetical protein